MKLMKKTLLEGRPHLQRPGPHKSESAPNLNLCVKLVKNSMHLAYKLKIYVYNSVTCGAI